MKKKLICILLLSAALFGCASCSLNLKGGVNYIAHRGLSAENFDNSEAAYRAAAASEDFWGIETDVRYTSDGVFVTVHDENPFYENPAKVSEVSYEEGMKLPLDAEGKEFLCLYEDYLDICKESGKTAVIEIKFDFDADAVDKVVEMAKARLAVDKFVVIAFSEDVVDYLFENHKDITFQWLISDENSIEVCLRKGYNLSVAHALLTKDTVKAFHEASLSVGVWTVNKQSDINKYVRWGVDYITTNG